MPYVDLTNISDAIIPEATWVNVICRKAEIKKTRSGSGEMISMTFQVTDGRFKDCYLWTNFNTKNESEIAVLMGLRELKSFMMNAGMQSPILDSPQELVGRKVRVQVGVEQSRDYAPRNIVLSYLQVPAPSLNLDEPPYKDEDKPITTDDIPF